MCGRSCNFRNVDRFLAEEACIRRTEVVDRQERELLLKGSMGTSKVCRLELVSFLSRQSRK